MRWRLILFVALVVYAVCLYRRYKTFEATGFGKTPGFGLWWVARRSFPLSLVRAREVSPAGAINLAP